jgi:hypothetical protein
MNSFKLHSKVVDSYRSYLKSFINIKDVRIKEYVRDAFNRSEFLPEPLIQFNPEYEKGEPIAELGDTVHPDLSYIVGDFKLYKHQAEAIKLGLSGQGFIVTSGTGSGKSLTFMATIFNHILNLKHKQKGIKAVIVYPMNALINSQEEEIKKYERNYLKNKGNINLHIDHLPLDEQIKQYEKATGLSFPITYGKYTGQEGSERREKMKQDPPDIILTNYMMLELIMTREPETWMRESFKEHLKYLVFDELHTYRGRQGADVSLLIRRIKGLADNPVITIGTSATMASEGTNDDKQEIIAEFANMIFGANLSKENIINEYLTPSGILLEGPSPALLKRRIDNGIKTDGDTKSFSFHPLVAWLEHYIALNYNRGRYERGEPMTIEDISKKLSEFAGSDLDKTKAVVRSILEWADSLNKKHEKSFLPFKIHQFISQTNTIYVSLEDKEKRYITLQKGNLFLNKESDTEKPI